MTTKSNALANSIGLSRRETMGRGGVVISVDMALPVQVI
jgi:hypothetical protein